jgi:hypothetical protein
MTIGWMGGAPPLACAECCQEVERVPLVGEMPSAELAVAITIMGGDALCVKHATTRVRSSHAVEPQPS